MTKPPPNEVVVPSIHSIIFAPHRCMKVAIEQEKNVQD